jgi:seryl-tRNA synthetase
MTLDLISFIDNKGGNAEEIRESQRKRGDSVEIVDEIIQMYADWVKSEYGIDTNHDGGEADVHFTLVIVDFEANGLSKNVNVVQKQIGAKKKVRLPCMTYRS